MQCIFGNGIKNKTCHFYVCIQSSEKLNLDIKNNYENAQRTQKLKAIFKSILRRSSNYDKKFTSILNVHHI